MDCYSHADVALIDLVIGDDFREQEGCQIVRQQYLSFAERYRRVHYASVAY